MISAERKKELDALRAKTGVSSTTKVSGIKAKVLARAQGKVEPKKGVQERLAEVGGDVAGQIERAIGGTGEFEGQTPIERGVKATAAGFSTIPRGLLALSPEPVRKTVEKVGEKVGEVAKKNIIDPLAETPLIKGAAGNEIVNPDGTVTYQENRAPVAEGVLGTLGAGGEIAGTVLGAGSAPQTAVRTSVLASRIAKRTAPVLKKTGKVVTAPVKGAVETGKNVSKFAVSKASGLEPDEISTIFRNPEKFSKKAREGVDREGFAENIGKDIKKRQEALSDLGEGYTAIRESGAKVVVGKEDIAKTLDQKFKIKYDGKKVSIDKESTPLTESERGQLESFLAKYSDTDEMSANAFLNARKALDGMSKWYEAGSSGGLKTIARSLRYVYNQAGRKQLKGLKKLDETYAPERKDLKILEKELYYTTGERRGQLKPQAVSRLANLTGKGKEDLLKRLEKMRPGITEEVNIIRAIEGIERATGNKVGAYAQNALGAGGIFTGFATGNPSWALLAIASYPKVAVNIIRGAGMVSRYGKEMVEKVSGKLRKGETLSVPEQEVVKQALKQPKPSRKVRKIIEEKAPEAYERVFKSSRKVGVAEEKSVLSPIQKRKTKAKVAVTKPLEKEVARETVEKKPKIEVLSKEKVRIEPLKLSGKDAKVQKKSIELYEKDPEALLSAYKKMPSTRGGRIVNADEARKLFKSVGYKGSNSQAVQEAASQVAKDVWREMLGKVKKRQVYITAGGSGTGKTSAVKNYMGEEMKGALILDGNLSKVRSAMQRLEEAIDAGKKPVVVYVYRDPIDAWENGVIKRMIENADEGGRVVPLSVFLQNHKGSHNVVSKLRKLGVDVRLIDNSKGAGKQRTMSADKFEKVRYDDVESKLRGIVEEKYAKKLITKEQKKKLLE